MHQRGFGSVGYVTEHGLAKKRVTKRHAVKPAGKLTVLPGFNRVRMTQPIELTVSLYHFLRNPGTTFATPRTGASFDDRFKCAVYANFKAFIAYRLSQAA